MRSEQFTRLFWSICALGLVLRLQGLNWDQGRGLHPDEGNLVRGALALAWPDRLLPEFHAYNDLALWLPRLASLPFCGSGDGACLTLIGRVLSALVSGATVPLIGWIAGQVVAAGWPGGQRRDSGPQSKPARAAGRGEPSAPFMSRNKQAAGAIAWQTQPASRTAALAAAALTAFSPALLQWAHFATTESALVLLMAALWALAIHWLRGGVGNLAMALASAALLGLGFGIKTSALAFALIPLTALLLGQGRVRDRFGWALLGLIVAGVIGIASAPSVLLRTSAWLDVMRFEGGVVSGQLDVFWTRQFAPAVKGLFELQQLTISLTLAGLVLALIGAASLGRGGLRYILPGLVFGLAYAAMILGWHAKFTRYLAPILPLMLVLAGIGAARLLASPARLPRTLALPLLGLPIVAGADFAASYQLIDPRIRAEAYLNREAYNGEVIGIEPYDLAQTRGLESRLLPLEGPEAAPLAEALAGVDWVVLASRRNWAVLPLRSDLAPFSCRFYARLAEGQLGFELVARFDRHTALGALFDPGLRAEETRSAFDRPEVLIFARSQRLTVEEIAQKLTDPVPPESCQAETLAESWRRR